MLQLWSLGGVVAMLAFCWLLSVNRRAINYRLVATGLFLQALLALVFLYWDRGNAALRSFGDKVNDFLNLSQAGASFVFGPLAQGTSLGFVFAFQVLPTLIFFASLMAVLYHLGVMQLVVRAMAVVMVRVMRTSGAESLSVAADIFVGQTEAPLLVRPYLPRVTSSELHAIMVGGFATIAGGVFAMYVSFGIPPSHLIVASVMAAPASLVCSKIVFPETETSETYGKVVVSKERAAHNVVEAAANGASDGLMLALNVGAMLIAFLGLVAVVDWLLGMVGPLAGFGDDPGEAPLSLKRVLGWLFFPIAATMGVEWRDVPVLAQLLGTKIALTELIAYTDLGTLIKQEAITPRTQMLAAFALCGFANVGSIAIQIGGLGAIAPNRKADVARLALRAMTTGALVTCMTACIAGIVARV